MFIIETPKRVWDGLKVKDVEEILPKLNCRYDLLRFNYGLKRYDKVAEGYGSYMRLYQPLEESIIRKCTGVTVYVIPKAKTINLSEGNTDSIGIWRWF